MVKHSKLKSFAGLLPVRILAVNNEAVKFCYSRQISNLRQWQKKSAEY